MQSPKHRPIPRQPATCRKPDVSFSPASSSGGAHDSVGCGNDGREEARGKPLAEFTGDDLRVVIFHRLPQPLESSVYTTDLSTFPQPEAVLVSLSHTPARLRRAQERSPRVAMVQPLKLQAHSSIRKCYHRPSEATLLFEQES